MSDSVARTTIWAPESSKRRLGIGSLWAASANLLALIGGLATTVILVRAMSRSSYGALAVGSAVIGFMTAVGGLGLGAAVARFGVSGRDDDGEAAAQHAARTAWDIARYAGICLALLGALTGALMQLSPRLSDAGLVVLVLLPLAVTAPYQSLATGFLAATFRPQLSAGLQVGLAAFQLALAGGAVLVGLTAAYQIGITRVIVGVFAVGALLWRLRIWRFARTVDGADALGHRELLGFGSAMTITTLAGIFISQLDVFTLGLVRGPADAGVYAPVSRLADVALLLPSAIGSYLLPALAAANKRSDRAQARHLYHWASRWGLILGAPVIGVLLVDPNAAIHLLFGDHVTGMSTPARILAAGMAVHFMFGFNGMTLDAFGDARIVAVRSGYGLLMSAAACLILIPLFGKVGAAVSTGIAILGLNALCSEMLRRRHQVPVWDQHVLAVVLATAIGILGAWFLLTTTGMKGALAVVVVAVVSTSPGLALSLVLDWPSLRRKVRAL